MPNYVVIAPPGSELSDRIIGSKFERWITISPDHAWAISSSIETCGDIRKRLQFPPPAEGTACVMVTCVVVKARQYNGYANRDLWEKLELWERT